MESFVKLKSKISATFEMNHLHLVKNILGIEIIRDKEKKNSCLG